MNKYKEGFFFSPEFVAENSWNGYEHNLLFECLGDGQFADVARPMGCDGIEDGRGVAVADFDDDGRLDVVINNNNAPPTIYMNRIGSAGSWLRLKAIGKAGGLRDALGAHAEVSIRQGNQTRTINRWVEAGSGYASQSELTMHFGLGDATSVESIRITWPDGEQQSFSGDQVTGLVNKTVVAEQGIPTLMTRPAAGRADVAGRDRGHIDGRYRFN